MNGFSSMDAENICANDELIWEKAERIYEILNLKQTRKWEMETHLSNG